MRKLFWLVLVISCAWGAYWVIGARNLQSAVEDLRALDQGIEYETAELHGFPNRFDLTLKEPRLSDPAKRLQWQAPFLQIFSLSYKPWHVIAAFPPEQRITFPRDAVTLFSKKMQASMVVSPTPAVPLDRAVIAATGLRALSDSGIEIGADSLHFGTRLENAASNRHEIGLELTGIHPPAGLDTAAIGLPPLIDRAKILVAADFSAPLDRYSRETLPQLRKLDIREAKLTWGEIAVSAQGMLSTDKNGRAKGEITLSLQNWDRVLQAAVDAGVIPPEAAKTWQQAAAMLAGQSPDAKTLTLPLNFKKGRVKIGPFTVGKAPRMDYLQ